MSDFELELRLDAPDAGEFGGALSDESARVRAQIYRKLRLKVHSNAWVRIKLSSASGKKKLQELIKACRDGSAAAGTGNVYEYLTETESASVDWWYLDTRTADDSFSLWDDYPSYKASEVASHHALNNTFVSARFVEICNQEGLRGISFLRCQKRGRKTDAGWYVALPNASLGRGLDHVWFDRQVWLNHVAAFPDRRTSAVDVGQYCFHQSCSRTDRVTQFHALSELLELFPTRSDYDSNLMGLTFVTVPRYWSENFPDADFAYVPWGEDGPNREGKQMRFRRLVVSSRARQCLIEAGICTSKSFIGLRSVATVEDGVENLDKGRDAIVPMYSEQELSDLKSREGRLEFA